MSDDHQRHRRRRQVLIVLVAAVLAPAILALAFLIPGHDPHPHGLGVVVAGTGSAADGLAARLPSQGFDVIRAPDAAAARVIVLRRDAYGAIVAGPPASAIVATAASAQATKVIEQAARSAGAQKVSDVRPLDHADPQGAALNLLVLPVVFTSTFLALTAIGLLPAAGVLERVSLAAAGSILGGGILMLIGRVALGVLPGPWFAELEVLAVAVLAMALPIGGLVRLYGVRAMGLGFVFFTVLGNPGSGLASAPELLPSPWHPLGAWLPPGAAGSALKGAAYFDGAGTTGPVLILAGWALLGLVLIVLGERRHPAGFATELHLGVTPDPEAEARAGGRFRREPAPHGATTGTL